MRNYIVNDAWIVLGYLIIVSFITFSLVLIGGIFHPFSVAFEIILVALFMVYRSFVLKNKQENGE